MLLDVAYDAYNLAPGFFVATRTAKMLSNRILSRPEVARGRVTNDGHWNRAGIIAIGKGATIQQRHSHRLKIVRRDRHIVRRNISAAGQRSSLDLDRARTGARVKRKPRNCR